MPALAADVSPQSAHTLRHIATQDLQLRASPTPKFEVEKPRRRSISPMSSSTPSSSRAIYSPPPLTWRTAFQDAKAGIYYTKDSFPSSNFLPPPFSREPVVVEAGERIEMLSDHDEYAVRVRVLRTGAVGLIPLWNTEGALERLTRINTAFNEAATCPVEARAMRRRGSESSASDDGASRSLTDASLSHHHARCIPFATRVRYPDFYGASSPFSDCDDDSDSDSLPSPDAEPERGRTMSSRAAVFQAKPATLERGGISGSGTSESEERETASTRSDSGGQRKSVNFDGERPQVVFRYPSEELVGLFLYERLEQEDGNVAEGLKTEGDDEWWWHGWEEEVGEDETDAIQNAHKQQLETVEEEVFPFVFFEEGL